MKASNKSQAASYLSIETGIALNATKARDSSVWLQVSLQVEHCIEPGTALSVTKARESTVCKQVSKPVSLRT